MTGRRAIIHIGLPKTGSTAIQGFLKASADGLRAQGAHFATAPGRRNHAMLATYALGDRARRGLQRRSAQLSGDQETFQSRLPALLEEEVRQLPDSIRTVIYSSEMIAPAVRSVDHAERLRTLFTPHFDEIRILVYLRRQDEAAVSAYSTALKAGGRTRFNILPDADAQQRYAYHHVLDVFAAAFGEGALMPRIFDRASLVGGDVVRDFLDACGLGGMEVPEDAATLVRGSAFRADVQEFLRRFNNLMDDRKLSGRKSVAAIVGKMAGRGSPRLPVRHEAEAFYAHFRESNEAVRARFFPDRPTLFREDFSRYPETDDSEAYSDSKVLDVAFDVLARVAPELARLDVDASFMQGRVAEATGRIEDAKEHYLRAAHSAIGHRKARDALERLGVRAGDYALANADAEDDAAPSEGALADDAAQPRRQRSKADKEARRQRRGAADAQTGDKPAGKADKEGRRQRRGATDAQTGDKPAGKADRKSRRLAKKASR